ncbi:hypothetical protein EJB05_29634, partial [Eragrostis curvula]
MLTLCSVHGPEHQQEVDEEGLATQLAQLCPALCGCAAHIAAGRFDDAISCLAYIKGLASLCDGPLQRLAKIMADGLGRCLLRVIPDPRLGIINKALIDPSSCFDQRSIRTARYNFVKLLPFLKMAYVAMNRVILDAMENEKFVHIIDLSGPAAHPWQWLKIMRAFRRRPEGAPDLRITVVHDDAAFLAETSALLREKAEALDMAFSFHGLLLRGRGLETLDFGGGGDLHDALALKSGYARAFSCALQMHRLLAGAVDDVLPEMRKMNHIHYPSPTTPLSSSAQATPSPQEEQRLVIVPLPPPLLARFLSALRAASAKVVAVAEQEAGGHNAPAGFAARFEAALHHYAALFDALAEDGAAEGQPLMQRAQVEQLLLGEEIRNMLARDDGAVERHEPLQLWAARIAGAGFEAVPLSYAAKMEADEVLRKRRVRGGYENRPHEGCLLLCRSGRPLYAVSAWRPWPSEEASVFGSSHQQQQYIVVPGQIAPTWTWPQEQAPVHSFTG